MADRLRYGKWQAPMQPWPADAERWAEFCRTAELRIRDVRFEDGRPDVKRCWRCRTTLSVDAFAINRTRPDGRQTACRSCRAVWERARCRRAKLAIVRDIVRRSA